MPGSKGVLKKNNKEACYQNTEDSVKDLPLVKSEPI